MASATAERYTVFRENNLVALPMAASTRVWAGVLICLSSTGYVVDGSDATGLTFAGVANKTVDNRDGDAADLDVEVNVTGSYRFASAALTQADVGKACYLLDNQTVVKSGHADLDYHLYVGRIEEVISATECWVKIEPKAKDPNRVQIHADVAGTNATTVDVSAVGTALGGSGLYVKAVHSMNRFTTSTGASAGRMVLTTDYTLSGGVLSVVADESAKRLFIGMTAIIKES